jgi:hypothetical protein
VNENAQRGHCFKFTAKEMNFMTQVAQSLSRDVEIPLRSSLQVEPLMTKSNTHGSLPGKATESLEHHPRNESEGSWVEPLAGFLSDHGLTVIDKPSVPPHESPEANIQFGGIAFFAPLSGLVFKPAE